MAVASWVANNTFSVGDIRSATTDEGTGLFFRCTTAGTTGSTEPGWPNLIGDTVTDGTCVWTAISATYADLSGLIPLCMVVMTFTTSTQEPTSSAKATSFLVRRSIRVCQ